MICKKYIHDLFALIFQDNSLFIGMSNFYHVSPQIYSMALWGYLITPNLVDILSTGAL